MNNTSKQLFTLLGLVFIQIFILNKVNVNGFVNPYIFPLFILLLPFDTKRWTLLLASFFLGLFIDLFNGTMGMHAFATTLMAFLRPVFLNYFESKSDSVNYPSLRTNGFIWMLTYITSLISVHHIAYFLIEVASFSHLIKTFLLIFFSILVSVFIIFLWLFTFKDAKR